MHTQTSGAPHTGIQEKWAAGEAGRQSQKGHTCRAYRKPVFLSWMQPMSRKLKVSSVTACPL